MSHAVWAQEENDPVPESQQSVLTDTEGDELLFPAEGEGAASGLGVGVYVRMVVVLLIVVVLIYGVFKFIKSNTGGDTLVADDTYLRRVAALPLGGGKSVQVVTLVDNAYLIGVSENVVNLISIIEDKELVSAMNISADKKEKTSRPKNFNEVLELFMPGNARQKPSAVPQHVASQRNNAAEAEDIIEALKNQGKRLNEVED